ncbi:MAG: prephenate dehydratase domain-containing protein, partial [Chloroflexaceae bacterium]
MTTIAYLGPAGTFSEEAALAYAASLPGATLLPLASIPAVVTAIETDAATVGVLPIENLLEGSVNYTLDLLIHETSLQIAGEIVIPIRQYLAARPGVQLSEASVLYAHPQSLGQCRKFIERCLPGVATVASLSNSAALREALADERPAEI